MNSESPDFQILSTSRSWVGTPEDYNSLKTLNFKDDGNGKVVIGYGQTIYATFAFQFEIPAVGLLRLTYVDSPSNKCIPEFQPFFDSEKNTPKEISYELMEGDFQGNRNMGGTRENGTQVVFTYKYRWLLKLGRSLYPEGLEVPFGNPLDFYGHGELGERVVGTAWMPEPRKPWWQFWK